jgi:hypothetical protein
MDNSALVRRSDAGKARLDKGASKSVPAKVKIALRALWDDPNEDMASAAKVAGIALNHLRTAMAQGHVRQWAWHERRALVDACAAGNAVALKAIRDNEDGNQMARVAAAKELRTMQEAFDDPGAPQRHVPPTAGITIVIEAPSVPRVIDVTPPPIEHEPSRHAWPSID